MSARPVGVGLVGAGAYGEFCLAAFAGVPEVRIAAVCDTDRTRAAQFAAQYGVPAYSALDDLLADDGVEIVALNTPPFLHAAQGLAALTAGKHLFCEKPLALTLADGEALRETAERAGLHLTVDYVMRTNPLWRAAAALRRSGAVGRLLHMDLINHAAGLSLPAHHWFWDKAQSGGIWIEHGVHFFDAFAWVAGCEGQVTGAQVFVNDAGQEDRVEALARFGDIAAHFYHGFTHSGATEQTTARLTFERAQVTLHEWVPTRMEALLAVDVPAAPIVELLTEGVLMTHGVSGGMNRLDVTLSQGKSAVYRACIQDGIRDLAHAVRGSSTALAVTAADGLASLRMAIEAAQH
jgi:predicted dehydrogenase